MVAQPTHGCATLNPMLRLLAMVAPPHMLRLDMDEYPVGHSKSNVGPRIWLRNLNMVAPLWNVGPNIWLRSVNIHRTSIVTDTRHQQFNCLIYLKCEIACVKKSQPKSVQRNCPLFPNQQLSCNIQVAGLTQT